MAGGGAGFFACGCFSEDASLELTAIGSAGEIAAVSPASEDAVTGSVAGSTGAFGFEEGAGRASGSACSAAGGTV